MKFRMNLKSILVLVFFSGILGISSVFVDLPQEVFLYTERKVPSNISELLDGFKNPDDTARPLTYWNWINGSVTKEGISADLEAMRKAGIAGAMIFDASIYVPFGGVVYGSNNGMS